MPIDRDARAVIERLRPDPVIEPFHERQYLPSGFVVQAPPALSNVWSHDDEILAECGRCSMRGEKVRREARMVPGRGRSTIGVCEFVHRRVSIVPRSVQDHEERK
jgi:hypothetical protein